MTEYIPIFLTMFILIDPLGVAMIYIGLVGGMNKRDQRRVAFKGPAIAFVVLTLFIFLGRQLIDALGIQPGSLYIAGGILLFLISIDLLFAKPKRTSTTAEDEAVMSDDIAIFPLALPLLSGPGAITAILIFVSENQTNVIFPIVLLIITFAILLSAVVMMFGANIISRLLGKTGVSVIERIMGILLSGMSVQFVYSGLARLGVL